MHTPDPLIALALIAGGLIVLAVFLKLWFGRLGIPALVGFIALGFLLRIVDHHWGLMPKEGEVVFSFLASIGIVCLLFRVGLESNLHELVDKLPRAIPIWLGNMIVSGVPAYLVAFYYLNLALIPSLFVAVALTATSVAVTIGVWQEAEVLNTENGELLLDVAELDDISGVVLLALLIAVVPILRDVNGNNSVLPTLMTTGAFLFFKAVLLGSLCLLVARFSQAAIARFIRQTGTPDPILVIAGIGVIIAAIAGYLGFSLAIGAFFAGLAFSRNPDVVKLDTAFGPIHDFFIPFFFIGIGLHINPDALTAASFLALILLAVAVLGKVIGAGVPTLFSMGWPAATLIGISMVPRAEIALVIMQEGQKLGSWAVPPELYAAMVMISAATCIVPPLIIRDLLQRWPQRKG